MSYLKILSMFAFVGLITFTGCKDDDDDPPPPPPPPPGQDDLSLNVNNLPDLGDNYVYEGWIIVEDFPISTGTFTINDDGNPVPSAFNLDEDQVFEADEFRITIEPSPDNDENPSGVVILAGDFDGNSAGLNIDHSAALGADFSDVSGSYVLQTPTDGPGTNEFSGVWWLTDAFGINLPSLTSLPDLPSEWRYEGWAIIEDRYVSTGKFDSATGSDDENQYSGVDNAPAFPGEDFLYNSPSDLNFPADLSGETLIISVEPNLDLGPGPFSIQPLVASVPNTPTPGDSYDMANNADSSTPTGVVTR